ncbi:MAG: hypothetical protein A2138_28000 [Deltaproteobacteria bacterium RBG_16_71_12]|nr:MAG: hypothetical protein A2138_28000 [Deltaproteobacteria bacterium RBG_16_71_12]
MTTVRDLKPSSAESADAEQDGVGGLAEQLLGQLRSLIRRWPLRDPIGRMAPELTSTQVHAFIALALDEAPLSMSTLAQRIDVALPAATGIVDRLERDGFVERLRDEGDRRLVLVRLTEQGKQMHGQAYEHMSTRLCQFLAALPETERVTFVDSVCRAISIVCGAGSKPPTDAT